MIDWNDIMAQYQLRLIFRHNQLLILPFIRHTQSPILITHNVVKLIYLLVLHHKWSHLPYLTAHVLLQFRLLLLLWMSSLIAPLPPPHLLLPHQRTSSVPFFSTTPLDHKRRTPSPISIKPRSSSSFLLKNLSLRANLFREQSLSSFPDSLNLSSMVLLTISVSDSIVQQSREVLQHSAPFRQVFWHSSSSFY